ncbi:unnamed protein product [Didymodactylos carnosus]|nr:unnamed protein product [Didymodactylos carnosus]
MEDGKLRPIQYLSRSLSPDDVVDQQIDLMSGRVNYIRTTTMASTSPFDSTTIQQRQLKGINIQLLYDKLLDGDHIKSLELHTGVIYKILQRRGRAKLKLPLIPTSMVKSLLEAYHDSPTSGHLGVNKAWNKIRDRYYWSGMYNTIKQHILSRKKCQQFKVSRTRPAGTLQPMAPPTGVLDLMGLDFIGPLPSSVAGNKYILVCTVYLSRWAFVTFAYNTSKQATTGIEPFKLMYGRDPILPFDAP